MKIPEKSYQFKKDKTLLIVSGRFSASFFTAEDGNIKKVKSFSVEKEPKKEEGVLKLKRKGMNHHGTALKDEKEEAKNKAERDFKKEFKNNLKEVNKGIRSIFIFTPKFMEGIIKDLLPQNTSGMIRGSFYGNFLNSHHLELVGKIHQFHTSKKVIISSGEARKILKKKK